VADGVRWWVLGSSLLLIASTVGMLGLWMRWLERKWVPPTDPPDTFEDIIATIRWDDE
jgi:hypothetical protein